MIPLLRVAVFASGNGSNAEVLLKASKSLSNLEISLIMTDQPEAKVIQRAQAFNCSAKTIPFNRTHKSYAEDKKKLIELLNDYQIDWIFLAGYMRILSPEFVAKYPSRIVNIHPSLLPKFPGPRGYEDAFNSDETHSGVTIHFVDDGVDTGEILLQEQFPRLSNDSLESFKQRGLMLEHELYPRVLTSLNNNGDLKRGYFE